jgi:nucleoside phosphorylase
MIVDRKWAQRNFGFDPIAHPAPPSMFSFAPAAKPKTVDDLRREIIEFDSEAPEGLAFLASTTATGLSRFTEIKWPKGREPKTDKTVRKGTGGRLPKADVLVVTWTVDEGHALSRVLTPGKDSRNDYRPYKRNFAKIAKKMRPGCPARNAGRLGAYWTATIGGKRFVVFKSESHMSQDGPQLPNIDVWAQIIDDVKPELVITTGTAGGIGKQFEVGDVIVSPVVRFDCTAKFKNKKIDNKSIAAEHFESAAIAPTQMATAKKLFKTNSAQLPPDNTRQPKIVRVGPTKLNQSVVTTDFFGFDISDNHYKLRGLGDVCEMGDAVLGLVADRLGTAAPRWVAVRNVSDPQIKAEGTLKEQATLAASIYKAFGRWSSVCSAIVCWALIAAEI